MQVGSLPQYASLGNISISSITYTVSNNTLNVDLPPLSIYLAPYLTPTSVTDPTDPRAVLFGTAPSIPAGTDPDRDGAAGLERRRHLPDVHRDLTTPFNFIAATTVEIGPGPRSRRGRSPST